MPTVSLLYHDVVRDGNFAASGFPGRDADKYKLDVREFQQHLNLLSEVVPAPPVTVDQVLHGEAGLDAWLMTFDDGGVSAATIAADCLGRLGWKAHFFVTTDFIDSEAFLSQDQIRDLRRAGHVIGTHSCSHPNPMAGCSNSVLLDEWRRSTQVLADILGEPVTCGSIPGGAYGRNVAAAAAKAGLRALFTSEPTGRCWHVDGCQVFGRYSYRFGTPGSTMSAYVAGARWPRIKIYLTWNGKKMIKRVAGPLFYRVRDRLLRHADGSAC